jgi:predicted ribosome quality control (RQC) complex YloA/Tae2 family protein
MQFLKDSRVDKIYHPRKEELLLQFHVTGKGKSILRIISGKFVFLTDYKENYDNPSGFCMFLRKYLSNSRMRKVEQIGSERVLRIVFEAKKVKYNLYAELFGKGNIVLTDENDMILNALEQKKWKDREIKKGLKYVFPKNKYDLFKIKKDELEGVFSSDKELVYKLAKDLGLGGTYAEEICKMAAVDKDKKRLTQEEVSKVFSKLKEMTKEKVKASINYKDGKIKDIIPFELGSLKDHEKKSFKTFNSAFDNFFKEEYAKEEFVSKHQSVIDKTSKIISQQEKQIKSLEKKTEENSKKGELLYEKYQVVDEVLKEINKARKKYSFDEIKKKLKGHKIVKEVNSKDKKVVVEL